MDMPKSKRRNKRMEYYVHHVPGRLRVRIPAIRKDPQKSSEVKQLLYVYGVEKIRINPLTGSVVITYDPSEVASDQILQILQSRELFDRDRAITCDQKIQRVSNKAASKVGRAVFGYAVSKALEANGLSVLAALI
jgi:copper chaperone CopZ